MIRDPKDQTTDPRLDWSTATVVPLREKYVTHAPAKFQGQKRKQSNSGKVGRRGERLKRAPR